MFNKLFPKGSKNRTRAQEIYFNSLVPKSISEHFIEVDAHHVNQLKASLKQNCYTYSSDAEIDLHYAALNSRLRDHRIKIVPWLASVRTLKGAKILEVGCGNGTSTVALAEQGAIVTAIDLDEGLLNDAINRCKTYDVTVEFHLMNVIDASTLLKHKQYDMIIFYAVLEHMTYDERLVAIKSTYAMLPQGGLWIVIDTPNRLHYYDSHTSMMPFFHWLPDELALKYASHSSRSEFKGSFEDVLVDDSKKIEFARWGRGMSFHEFELSLMPIGQLKIISTLSDFLIRRSLLYNFATSITPNAKYVHFLKKQYPQIHAGLFQPYLNLIVEVI